MQRWLLQKTGLTISDLVTLQNFTVKQSAHTTDKSVQDSIASESLESAVTAPSLGSVNSRQSVALDRSGSLPEDDVPALPSALSKKLDRFIRQGLSQQPLQPLPPSEPHSEFSICLISLRRMLPLSQVAAVLQMKPRHALSTIHLQRCTDVITKNLIPSKTIIRSTCQRYASRSLTLRNLNAKRAGPIT